MNIKIFTIPILQGEHLEAEMNRFLQQKIIVEVQSQLIASNGGAYWTFCVRYVEKSSRSSGYFSTSNEKKDYKKILGEAIFKRFLLLKKIRKQIAEKEEIPAYAVCTDASLGEVAKLEEITLSSMQKASLAH